MNTTDDFSKAGWGGHALLGRIAAEGLSEEFWKVVQPPLTAELLGRDYFAKAPEIRSPADLLGFLCAINDLVYFPQCRPYATLPDGHWIPHTPPDANWQSAPGSGQAYSRKASQDILQLLFNRTIESVQAGDWVVFAHHAGALAHYAQEPFTPGHAVDNALFHELFPDPDPGRHLRLHHFFDCASGGYPPPHPQLLGTSPAEAAWRTVLRVDQGIRSGKGLIAPVIASAYAGEGVEEQAALLRGQSQMACQLTADLWHTVLCLGLGKFDPAEVESLRTLPLTGLIPSFWHAWQYVEPTPGCFVEKQRKVPLWICGENGEERVTDGFAVGGHMGVKYFVDGDVAGRFRCRVALPSRHHEGQLPQMQTTFSVETDVRENQTYSEEMLYGAESRFSCQITPKMKPVEVDVSLAGAKTLILVTRSRPVPDPETELPRFYIPHLAICEPRMERATNP